MVNEAALTEFLANRHIAESALANYAAACDADAQRFRVFASEKARQESSAKCAELARNALAALKRI